MHNNAIADQNKLIVDTSYLSDQIEDVNETYEEYQMRTAKLYDPTGTMDIAP